MSTQNYTLEKHLKSLATEDKDYEVLYSIWELNKQNLAQGLNIIASAFPHYSRHDISHTMNLINNIQCFLGEDRIKQLGATDTFLLLMAGLTHDIGMILTYKIIEEEWKKEDIKTFLEELSTNNDKILADHANLLLRYAQERNTVDSFKWALEVKNAVVVITAEIFRSKHAQQSAKNLLSNEDFKQLAENFHFDQLPNRFMELLAQVAQLHGESFDNVMSKLHFKANGYKGDYIHPRFIACMIRLGDLLDFDNNRFNLYSIATIDKIPETSLFHQQKHAAVKHMLVSPESIEVELDCIDENVYRTAKSWFDWLQDEVNNQSLNWIDISPANLEGLPPIINKKDSIRILYKGIDSRPELLNLKFTMSQQKMFNILKGGGIYKEPGFAFIREIVQNAFDATKVQIWNDIVDGALNYTPEFPDDIPPEFYSKYPIELTIKWKEGEGIEKETLCIECSDRGTGISEATLIRMTQRVGDSYNGDINYTQICQKIPYWLKPTAAFGIGLQSIFFVASEFIAETAYLGETKKRIVFRPASDNQYSTIVDDTLQRSRGTIIKVEIPKKRFPELFGTSFSWDILRNVDVFEGYGDDIYLAKIDDFVKQTFIGIENMHFKYNAENSKRNIIPRPIKKNKNKTTPKITGNYKYSFEYQDDFLIFKIYEKQYGSTLKLWFNKSLNNDFLPQRLLLRDIIISNAKSNYYKTSYLGYEWNLNNQKSDKVVDLSRDNLTYEGKTFVTNTLLESLLPQALILIGSYFEKLLKKETVSSSALHYQYLNYCLTAYACNLSCFDASYLKDTMLPSKIVSKDKEAISGQTLLETSELCIVDGFDTDGYRRVLDSTKNEIEKKYNKELSHKIVIWGHNSLENALIYNFRCTEILQYDSKCQIYKLSKGNIQEIGVINKWNKKYLNQLGESIYHGCSRKILYGLDTYSALIVKRIYVSGFEIFPAYSSCCIFSPFKDFQQTQKILRDIEGKENENIMDYIKCNLSEYISPYMIQVVKANNINETITEEQIKTGYIKLIYDFIQVNKKYPPQKKKS